MVSQRTLVRAQSVCSTLWDLFVALLVLSPSNHGGGGTKKKKRTGNTGLNESDFSILEMQVSVNVILWNGLTLTPCHDRYLWGQIFVRYQKNITFFLILFWKSQNYICENKWMQQSRRRFDNIFSLLFSFSMQGWTDSAQTSHFSYCWTVVTRLSLIYKALFWH